MSEDKEIKHPDVSILEHTVEEPYSGRKIMIVGDTEYSPRLQMMLSQHLIESTVIVDSDDGCWENPWDTSKNRPEPIEIKKRPEIPLSDFSMSPQPRPSKHRNKKYHTRKKAGKKTHRKR